MYNLKWKILISILLLISFVCVSIFLPIYWKTRISMEEQLQTHLIEQLELISNDIDANKIKYLNELQTHNINKNISEILSKKLDIISAKSIFLFNNDGLILAFSGDGNNATKTLMLHKYLLNQKSVKSTITPVFEGLDNNYYLSVFIRLDEDFLLGISADAQYLENLVDLQRQMIIITLVSLLITSFMALLFSSSLTKPLHKLTIFANQIGSGRSDKLDYDKRKDEIGFLYKTMVDMQKKIQKRENENKQIVASVAHELRNPIAGMQINLELLMEELENEADSYKFSQLAHKDILKLAQIVDSFLNYSRPIDSNLKSYEIHKIIEELLNTNPLSEQNNRFNISGNALVKVHRNKIKYAFNNLMQNALDASNQIINIEIDKDDNFVKIKFENFGEPINDKSQIFEAFFSTKENGVGLGLPIAKSIVEQHGGEINLEKSNDTGTLFVITLPAL